MIRMHAIFGRATGNPAAEGTREPKRAFASPVRALATRCARVALEPVPGVGVELRPPAAAVVVARDETGDDAERRERDVQQVVGRVDREQAEYVLPVDQTDDGDEAVDQAEPERDGSSGGAPGRGGQQNESGCDVHEVVDGVDLEAEEQVALDTVTRVEARIGDEAEDAGEEQRKAGE